MKKSVSIFPALIIPLKFFTLQMWDLGLDYGDIGIIHGLGPFLTIALAPILGKNDTNNVNS